MSGADQPGAPVTTSALQPSDEPLLRTWLRTYLREHLVWWTRATGEHWVGETVERHIDAHDLVGRELRELQRAADSPKAMVRVARRGGVPVGVVYAEVREDRYMRRERGVISWLFTEPDARGEGVAKLLLDVADGWFSWRGLGTREVFVTVDNPAAVHVYQRQGFVVADHRMLAGPPGVTESVVRPWRDEAEPE